MEAEIMDAVVRVNAIKGEMIKLVKKVGGCAARVYVANQMCRKMKLYNTYRDHDRQVYENMLLLVDETVESGRLVRYGDGVVSAD